MFVMLEDFIELMVVYVVLLSYHYVIVLLECFNSYCVDTYNLFYEYFIGRLMVIASVDCSIRVF